MKLNNKGFAITAVLYGLLILFVMLVSSYLLVLSARKNRVDNLVRDIEKEYLSNIDNDENNSGENNGSEDNPIEEVIYTVTLNSGPLAKEGTGVIYYFKNDNIWYFDVEGTDEIRYIELPTLNNYVFNGYYTLENGSGTQIINNIGSIINSNISGDTVLYAYWTRNSGGDVSA